MRILYEIVRAFRDKYVNHLRHSTRVLAGITWFALVIHTPIDTPQGVNRIVIWISTKLLI